MMLDEIKAAKKYALNGGPFGSKLVTNDYIPEGVPVIRGTNLSKDTYFSFEDLVFVSEEKADELKPNNAHPGDIIFTQRGTLGQVGIIPKICKYKRFVISQSQMKLTVDEIKTDSYFIYYYFRNPNTIQRIKNLAFSSGVPHINLQVLREFEIELPPLPTQRKIAAILSAYDDLIENNTRRIKILEEMASALYREWFVNFRFPGHEKVRMEESELGPKPEGWEVYTLESVCQRITDGSHWSPKSVSNGFPMASVKDMHDWGFDITKCRQIGEEDYQKLVHNDCKPLKEDVLIAKDGSYLKHIFVVEKEIDLVILSSIAILRPNGRMLPHLLAMYLKDPSVEARMKGYVSGVAVPRIVLKDFRKFKIVIPPKNLQHNWFELAEPMIEQCWRLISKNANLRQTRDFLLPKLISSEMDVSELDIKIHDGEGA